MIDGGAAFPGGFAPDGSPSGESCGISAREYFAVKALPALISAMIGRRNEANFPDFDASAVHEAVRLSFVAADDIIDARKRKE